MLSKERESTVREEREKEMEDTVHDSVDPHDWSVEKEGDPKDKDQE